MTAAITARSGTLEWRDDKDIITDVVVIGSGPGGEGAAMKAAKEGRTVVMVDSQLPVGGNCTHKGTIPSKALRQVVREAVGFRKSRYGHKMDHLSFGELKKTNWY